MPRMLTDHAAPRWARGGARRARGRSREGNALRHLSRNAARVNAHCHFCLAAYDLEERRQEGPDLSSVLKRQFSARSRRKTISVKSHVMSELEELAARIHFCHGVVRFSGTQSELKRPPATTLERAIAD